MAYNITPDDFSLKSRATTPGKWPQLSTLVGGCSDTSIPTCPRPRRKPNAITVAQDLEPGCAAGLLPTPPASGTFPKFDSATIGTVRLHPPTESSAPRETLHTPPRETSHMQTNQDIEALLHILPQSAIKAAELCRQGKTSIALLAAMNTLKNDRKELNVAVNEKNKLIPCLYEKDSEIGILNSKIQLLNRQCSRLEVELDSARDGLQQYFDSSSSGACKAEQLKAFQRTTNHAQETSKTAVIFGETGDTGASDAEDSEGSVETWNSPAVPRKVIIDDDDENDTMGDTVVMGNIPFAYCRSQRMQEDKESALRKKTPSRPVRAKGRCYRSSPSKLDDTTAGVSGNRFLEASSQDSTFQSNQSNDSANDMPSDELIRAAQLGTRRRPRKVGRYSE